jgi:TP901 family phage tail tape measure protein
MADNVFATLWAELKGDPTGFNRTLDDAHGRLMGFARFASQLTIGIGVAGFAGLGYAVKQAGDLEAEFANFRKTTGLSIEDIATLRQGIVGIATDSRMAGVSLEDLMGIAQVGGRLGIAEGGVGPLIEYTRALGMVKVAMDDIPVEEAANSMGQILHVFNLGADRALYFASVVDQLADSTTASSRGIFDITQRLASTAQTIGLTLPQTAALATAIADMGNQAELSGTAIQTILTTMATSPEEFAKATHLTTEEFRKLTAANPMEALRQTIEALSKMGGAARFTGLAQLGIDGKRAQQVMLGLTQQLDSLDKLTAQANAEWQSGGHILNSLSVNAQTAWSQLTLLWNNVKITAAELGGHFLPVLKAAAAGFAELAQDIKQYLEDNKGTLEGWGQAMARTMSYVGLLWKEFPTFLDIAKTIMGEAFADMTDMFEKFGQNLKTIAEYIGEVISTTIKNAFIDLQQEAANLIHIPEIKVALNMFAPTVSDALEAIAQDAPQRQRLPSLDDVVGLGGQPRFPLVNPFQAFGQVSPAARDRLAQDQQQLDAARADRDKAKKAAEDANPLAPGGAGAPATPAAGSGWLGAVADGVAQGFGGVKDSLVEAAGAAVETMGQGLQGFLAGNQQMLPMTPETRAPEFVGLAEMMLRVQTAEQGGGDPQKQQVEYLKQLVESHNRAVEFLQEMVGKAFPAVTV